MIWYLTVSTRWHVSDVSPSAVAVYVCLGTLSDAVVHTGEEEIPPLLPVERDETLGPDSIETIWLEFWLEK